MNEEVINDVVSVEPKKKREKKKKSIARKIVEWVLFSIFGVFFVFVVAGNISGEVHKEENYGQSIRFGIGSFIVLTNSMEPEIKQDSAIITYKQDLTSLVADFYAGQTVDITFANINSGASYVPTNPKYNNPVITNRVMTHRLVEVKVYEDVAEGKGRYAFVTAGINAGGDHSKEGQYQIFTEKQYLGRVKVTNAFLGKVFNFVVSPVGLIILLLLPAAYLIIVSTIDIFRAMKQSEEENAAVMGGDKLKNLTNEQRAQLKKQLLDEMIKQKREEKENGSKD